MTFGGKAVRERRPRLESARGIERQAKESQTGVGMPPALMGRGRLGRLSGALFALLVAGLLCQAAPAQAFIPLQFDWHPAAPGLDSDETDGRAAGEPDGGAGPGPAASDTSPTIFWFGGGHYPPTFIAHGDRAGEGYGDKSLAWIIARLPGYRHQMVVSSFNRGLQAIKDRPNACMYGVLRSAEREAFMQFSKPVSVTLSNRVIVMRENAGLMRPFLDDAGQIWLSPLMAEETLTFGVITDRFYSTAINAAAKQHAGHPNRIEITDSRYGALLLRGRIDYTFGYPYEAAYQFADLGAPGAFVSFPIAGEKAYMTGHVGCARSATGASLVKALDAVVDAAGPRPPFLTYMEEWLDAAALTDYRRALDSVRR